MSRFQHMAEVLHGFVDGQQLAVVRAVFLLGRVEFLGEECGGLPGVPDPLLQHGTHGGGGGVGDEGKWRQWVRVCQECGARQTPLALFEGLEEFWCPSDGVGAFDPGA
jgi:hypothetical protein